MKKLYLIDVSAMFFRAYYAVRPLTSPTGVPVNAIYGFLSMIVKLLKEEKPEYLVFCYDRKEPSFRKDMYVDYKANRTEMPDDLQVQVPYIKRLADLLGIPSFEAPGFEADDIIGTLTCWGRANNFEVFIVSGDKDFSQLVQPHVWLYDTMKNVKYDSDGVKAKWGVRPDQFLDYLAIVGDSSDNVPGVRGIGEKGAAKLLEQFKTLEDIYENLEQVAGKSLKEKLAANKDMAFLSKKLVTITCDVEMPREASAYRLAPFKSAELKEFLTELNFKSFERSLFGQNGEAAVPSDKSSLPTEEQGAPVPPLNPTLSEEPSLVVIKDSYELTFVQSSAETLGEILQKDQELWGVLHNQRVLLSDEKTVYEITDRSGLGELTDRLGIRWKGFDLKAFWHHIGSQKPAIAWDSQLAAYVLEAGDTTDFNKVFTRYMLEEILPVAEPTTVLIHHFNFAKTLKMKLESVQGDRIYRDFDLPLAPILLGMENSGVRLDIEFLKHQSEDLGQEISILEKEIHQVAGEEFNIGSPKQLGVILFEKMGLPTGKKTKTGYSTGEDVLVGLDHPIAKLVLKWRELSKLKSTYVDALPGLVNPADGRIHTNFRQALTTTGRLSSINPNLQNIPIRTPRGQQVRKAFIADAGNKLLSVDYSQIELRILAHISEDPNLVRAFHEGLDIHTATAAEIYSVPLKEVTSDLRRSAKAVNFGIAYGQGAFGLSENLGISVGEAKDIIERYFKRFKNVREYIEQTVKLAHEQGYVETLFGRRRYIEELKAKNAMLRKFGERAAINAPIQGTASDLVKKAMIEVAQQVRIKMLLQVHDELIFEDTEENLNAEISKLVSIMENVAQLKVPLKVNWAIGNNWDEAH